MIQKKRSFQAIVLAGGFGTRLRSISGTIPKPMMPVGGVPFVYHLLKRLELYGADRIVLALHYNAELIIEQVMRDSPVNCEILFSVESLPLGTGGAIKQAVSLLRNDRFIVLNGDTFLDIDYHDLIDSSVDHDLFMAAVWVEDQSRYGAIDISEIGRVNFIGKGMMRAGPINSGAYVVNKSSILSVSADRFGFEEEYVKLFSESLGAKVYNAQFIDIGVPEDYFRAVRLFE